jgi:predicted secreted protein
MSVTTAIAIYFLIWWLTLFAVLPFGVRSQHEDGDMVPGSDPGAPIVPRLLWKLFWTTIVSGVIFAILYVVYVNKLITFDDMMKLFGMPR